MAQPVITNQPLNLQFKLTPSLQDKGQCPPGLGYLAQIDQLIVKQQIELLELITGFETNNKYKIFNSVGQQVFYAAEETSCLMRQCCGPQRGFTIHVTDNDNKEVMRIVREFRCCAGCCWCATLSCDACSYHLQVESPPGIVIGYVRQLQSKCNPHMGIFDGNFELQGHVRGPCCPCNSPCCGDVEFPVTAVENNQESTEKCAMVAKQWTGVGLEWLTDADTFSVRFPLGMDVKAKATLLAATFMVDFMFFEESKNNNDG